MDAIGRIQPAPHPWEKKENPQTYALQPVYGEHPRPAQALLGMVGGNNAPYKDRKLQVELESDLRGITRANTFCPKRQHHPLSSGATSVTRDTPKETVTVPIYHQPLKGFQLWAYPATLAPEPYKVEVCMQPHKY